MKIEGAYAEGSVIQTEEGDRPMGNRDRPRREPKKPKQPKKPAPPNRVSRV
jgi:hypothetical protein